MVTLFLIVCIILFLISFFALYHKKLKILFTKIFNFKKKEKPKDTIKKEENDKAKEKDKSLEKKEKRFGRSKIQSRPVLLPPSKEVLKLNENLKVETSNKNEINKKGISKDELSKVLSESIDDTFLEDNSFNSKNFVFNSSKKRVYDKFDFEREKDNIKEDFVYKNHFNKNDYGREKSDDELRYQIEEDDLDFDAEDNDKFFEEFDKFLEEREKKEKRGKNSNLNFDDEDDDEGLEFLKKYKKDFSGMNSNSSNEDKEDFSNYIKQNDKNNEDDDEDFSKYILQDDEEDEENLDSQNYLKEPDNIEIDGQKVDLNKLSPKIKRLLLNGVLDRKNYD